MSFHPLKGQNGEERELGEGPDRDMGKPAAGDIRDRSLVPAVVFVQGLKVDRCPFTDGFQSEGSRILFEKNTVSLMWAI